MLLPRLTFLVLLLLCSTLLHAQQTITGKTQDSNTGRPIPGVTVRIPNSNRGTVTGADGKFSIISPNTSTSTTLIFSSTGYKTKTVNASANAGPLTVSLDENLSVMDEVVVTGMATSVKRRNLANAVATISSKQLAGVAPAQTFDAALSGKIPGALVTASSGAPGGGISVKLRGITSVFGNSQPLYVVDGIFFNNNSIPAALNDVTAAATAGNPNNQDNPSSRIADLNPADIENIEILKGASAAALYGAKAAAGVIIITTKKGKNGKTSISVNQETGIVKARHLLGVRNFTPETAADLAGPSSSADPDVIKARGWYKYKFEQARASGKIFDYEKEMYGETGIISNTSIALSGGSEKTTFYLSGNRRKEDGIIKNTGYLNNSVRLNVDHKVNDRISVSVTTNYINSSADRGLTNNDNNGVSYGVALSSTPGWIDLYPNAVGVYPRDSFAASNPLETRDKMTNNETTNRFVGGGNIDAILAQSKTSTTKIVLRGGVDYFNFKTAAIFPRELQFEEKGMQGHSIQGNSNNLNTNLAGFLINIYNPHKNLTLTSTLGATYETGNFDNISTTATNITSGQSNLDQSGSTTVRQFRQQFRDNGIFLQEDLTLLEDITVSGGVRFDRSTNNGDYKKYYVYPKASFSWNLAQRLLPTVSAIDFIKIRAAYGQSGNIPPYGSKFTGLIPSNINSLPGLLNDNLRGNPDILPERQAELEAGMDFGLFNNRIRLEATYYNKKINDLLLRRALNASSGYSSEWKNSGDLRNTGIELGLTTVPLAMENLRWTSTLNWWKNKAVVTKLTIPAFAIGAFGNSLGTYYLEEGQPATQIKGISGGELKLLGNSEPKFQMSFFNEFTIYKNFSLQFLLHWKNGGQNINLTQLLTDAGATSFDYDEDYKGAKLGAYRVNAGDAAIYVQDAAYVRLREIAVYYNVPLKNTNYIKGIRLGISANNFLTWTNYVGYDPEVSNFGSNTMTTTQSRGSNGISSGVDVMPFPASKRASFHLGVNF
ncbi:SusC/RagA family TonB-linked outer membrane protein [Chitinophaga sp. sic0106]|uniref:SusC/RagA family TonB-linked outer membrane protein n=1 Tax=Chitinophaga sp. sic0106 TaxID=2854785 RepID=UPI001C486AE7|nr:SusC/RagA family TonB-linked outer membrane protein [Chitinophaga sp. sic0106]MBV7534116.1 SusC/RagA family TonB-linked outer membrane protein [Chitinophaga sp. sic0106]